MKPYPVSNGDLAQAVASKPGGPKTAGGQNFDQALQSALLGGARAQSLLQPASKPPAVSPSVRPPPAFSLKPAGVVSNSAARAQTAYGKLAPPAAARRPQMSGWQKYQDDQLLRNPGGRSYTDQGQPAGGGKPVSRLIGGDLSGVAGNIGNFFANLFKGAKVHYRDENNQVREAHQAGVLGTIGNFFRDFASALSFGAYHPDLKQPVHGFKNRLLYSASKLKEAFLGDLVDGVPSSVNHMAQNAVLAGWRLVEVLPDAALGRFGAGQKLTTKIFDNGQVAVEYLTDIVPSGDAWLRVHGADWGKLTPPVLYNLKMPEHFDGDERWRHVRNTPFRKTIETIGSLVADGLAVGFLGQTGGSSNHRGPID